MPELPIAIRDAHHARHGTTLAAWEEALRTLVQQQMELAVLRLSQDAPGLLDDEGPKILTLDLAFPLPAGETLAFRASLELVE
jgi:hypothetical protein